MASFDTIDDRCTNAESGSSALPRQTSVGGLSSEFELIRQLVAECEEGIRDGRCRRLPGNVAFLKDGRVLCRERARGDSRYPYGDDGFNFWVNASGRMHGNRGLYFLFLPSTEMQEPPITFFFGTRCDETQEFDSHAILPVPYLDRSEDAIVDRYTVLGHDATYFVAETSAMRSVVRVFLDQARPEHAHVNFSVLVQNLTDQPIASYLSGYMNPFCRHQFGETNEDRWFKKISVDSHPASALESKPVQGSAGTVLPPFLITTNEDVDRFRSVTNYALIRRVVSMSEGPSGPAVEVQVQHCDLDNGQPLPVGTVVAQECTSRLGYLGSARRDLSSAEFLRTGKLGLEVPVTVFNENAIMGDLLGFTLPPGGEARADYVLSIPENIEILDLERSRPLGPEGIDASLSRVGKKLQAPGNLQIAVGESREHTIDTEAFNKFLPYLKKQVAICATLKGYMTPSPNALIGFRDVLQAIDAHLFDHPTEARAKILETMGHVLEDGRCPRQYSLPVNGAPGRVDLREFIDQGVWAISTVYNYLAVTGDASILDEQVGYHGFNPSEMSLSYPTDTVDSVLEHLLRIMDYLSRQRDPETGLVLALYGDWNDALDGLGVTTVPDKEFGTGVSVMASLQFYANCAEIVEILSRHSADRFEKEINHYGSLRDQLRNGLFKYAVVAQADERRILHGWGDRREYLVGSFCDSDGLARDGLTSYAFWVLSGMLDEDRSLQEDILAALERLDSRYGLNTFEPGFAPDATGVGRIVKLPVGTAENGATYIHATTFGIAALFLMGQPQKAWQQIAKILPFESHHTDPSHSPFVMPNSYINNVELNLTGQSMNDWQTGCSNVLLKLLIRYAFGLQPQIDKLRISPAAWVPFDRFEIQAVVHGKSITLNYEHADVTQREIELNGVIVEDIAFDDTISTLAATIPYELFASDQLNVISVRDPQVG